MYEVEFKVELTAEQKQKLIDIFDEKNFKSKSITPKNDYYIEAEIDVEDKSDVIKTKNLIVSFLKFILDKDEIIESPDVFTMAFKKL